MAFSDPGKGRIIEQMVSASVAALEPGSRDDSTIT